MSRKRWGDGQIITRVKPSDETVNNSATHQDDDDIAGIALPANTIWAWDFTLCYNSGTTPDIKTKWILAAGGAGSVWTVQYPSNLDATPAGTLNMTSDLVLPGIAADVVTRFTGIFEVVAAITDLKFSWAQNTANASDTKVLAGTNLLLRRL
jgi:hypothetical protein